MVKYCTKCGKRLDENGRCENCKSSDWTEILETVKGYVKKAIVWCMARIGLGCETEEETLDVFERDKLIVPDIIHPNAGETPIKQYNIARLRSRILQKRSEGRLQITNKRVIFRATGLSLSGRTALQHEFQVGEIGGIDIKKSTRLSPLNMFLALILALIIISPCSVLFEAFNDASLVWSAVVGSILSVAPIALFLAVKKKFWIKFIALSAGMGIMLGVTNISSIAFEIALGEFIFGITDILLSIITFIWIFNWIIVGFVPELRIVFRTKSASETIQIRKKIWGFFLKQNNEYTDFGEVLPWKDTDKAIQELGAMIDDIQTMGDLAIEKWQDANKTN